MAFVSTEGSTSCRFEMRWGWVNEDRVNYPFNIGLVMHLLLHTSQQTLMKPEYSIWKIYEYWGVFTVFSFLKYVNSKLQILLWMLSFLNNRTQCYNTDHHIGLAWHKNNNLSKFLSDFLWSIRRDNTIMITAVP